MLLPVTTAVTSVRLETALNAVCENASCRWTLHNRISVQFGNADNADVMNFLAQAIKCSWQIDAAASSCDVCRSEARSTLRCRAPPVRSSSERGECCPRCPIPDLQIAAT